MRIDELRRRVLKTDFQAGMPPEVRAHVDLAKARAHFWREVQRWTMYLACAIGVAACGAALAWWAEVARLTWFVWWLNGATFALMLVRTAAHRRYLSYSTVATTIEDESRMNQILDMLREGDDDGSRSEAGRSDD